jgi:uncharacterized membrane protein
MKRFIIGVFFSIFLLSNVSAQVMYQLNVTTEILDDTTTHTKINFQFSEGMSEINFPFTGEIRDFKVTDGKCSIKEEEIIKIIHCEPSSKFIVGRATIKTEFMQIGLIQKSGNVSFFSFDIPILWPTDKIFVNIGLPSGSVITEKVIIPVSPSEGFIGSDGKRITTSWNFIEKAPGDIIPIRIYYESLSTTGRVDYLRYRWLIAIVLIMLASFIFIYKKFSKKSELVLSVLNEGERMIVDIIKKEGKNEVDQRKIVAQVGFSKAKVSRIVQSLVGRGIVDVERVGKRNKITLKKIIEE